MTNHDAEAQRHLQTLNNNPPDDRTEAYELLLDIRSALIALIHATIENGETLHRVECAIGDASDRITEAVE